MAKRNKVVAMFPVLDWAALSKETTLSVHECATAMGVSVAQWRDDRLLALRLCEAIRDHRDDLYVKSSGDGISILNDIEAEEYSWKRVRQHVNGIARQGARRLTSIDREALGTDQRRIAEARDLAIGRAAIEARRSLSGPAVRALLTDGKEEEED